MEDNIIPFPLKRQLARQMAKSIAESTLQDVNEILAILWPETTRGKAEKPIKFDPNF